MIGNRGHFALIRGNASPEQFHLQVRPVALISGHLLSGDWLDDVVEVTRYAARVRPQAVVDLFSVNELAGDPRCVLQERAKFGGFGAREVGYCSHVPFRLDDQGAEPQRADAVFNQPSICTVNEATWQWLPSGS